MTDGTSQAGETFQFDALVIGSGMAGLHYALTLQRLHPQANIAILSKQQFTESNSRYAQGGIAAFHTSEDSADSHMEDTLKAGDGLSYKPVVEQIIKAAPKAIETLGTHFGVKFEKDNTHDFSLGQEGGHSHRRIFHCGDKTGLVVTQALVDAVENHGNITILEQHIAVNLITHATPHQTTAQHAEVHGAYVLDTQSQKIHTVLASVVVLATGGAGKVYQYTTNSMVSTGDGVAMACRAGARVSNMEFYQFHPTLLFHPQCNNFLISEAVRGEGALLKRPDNQHRFMTDYAPEALELATRDIVARAIFSEIEQSDLDYVYLDITHKSAAFLKKRFPNIYHTLHSIGIDMSQDMIPVVPAAHYQCGGVITDVKGHTDIHRLFAIGEVACTGLHGANRLASNSLLEALVMGEQAAHASLSMISTPIQYKPAPNAWNSPQAVNPRRASQINAHWRSLRGEMTSYAGIIRTEAGLQDLLTLIRKRQTMIEEYYWNHTINRDFIELRNIILNAELIARGALARRESRGGHYREDFPQKHPTPEESIEHFGFIEMV